MRSLADDDLARSGSIPLTEIDRTLLAAMESIRDAG